MWFIERSSSCLRDVAVGVASHGGHDSSNGIRDARQRRLGASRPAQQAPLDHHRYQQTLPANLSRQARCCQHDLCCSVQHGLSDTGRKPRLASTTSVARGCFQQHRACRSSCHDAVRHHQSVNLSAQPNIQDSAVSPHANKQRHACQRQSQPTRPEFCVHSRTAWQREVTHTFVVMHAHGGGSR